VNWAWDFGDATSSAMLSPTHTYQQSGTYSVSLTATPVDCPNQVTTSIKNVVVEQRVQDIRYPIVNAVSNQPVRLQARSFGAEYSWSPGTGLSSAMVVNPVFRHDQSLEYLITIKTLGSCVTVDTLQVRVFKFIDILLPNAFTPNNDGLNDKLEFFLIGIEQFKFLRIFNRWGQLVFETNNEKTFWNGAKNGSLQPSDVYVWVAEGIGVDGSKVARKGTVTLIKK
jgi:gliding motility-associated-like protein